MNSLRLPDIPAGYHLNQAILTTFDLDMNTLEALLSDAGEPSGEMDPKRFLIFHGEGDFVSLRNLEGDNPEGGEPEGGVPEPGNRESDGLESGSSDPSRSEPSGCEGRSGVLPAALRRQLPSQVVKCAFPKTEDSKPSAFMHGKVWLFEYDPDDSLRSAPLYRLLIRSANISSCDNLETTVSFIGSAGRDPAPEGTKPLCRWLRDLIPFITDQTLEAEEKRRCMEDLIKRLEPVLFMPLNLTAGALASDRPEADAAAAGGGVISTSADESRPPARSMEEALSHAPLCSRYDLLDLGREHGDFLHAPWDELVLISPFITPAMLQSIFLQQKPGGRCVILSNLDTICRLIRELPPEIIRRIAFLEPSVREDGSLPFLHAKVFLRRQGGHRDLWCGSMNLTGYSMNHNMEFMVRMADPSLSASNSSALPDSTEEGLRPEAFLAAFLGTDPSTIAGIIRDQLSDSENVFEAADPMADSEDVFEAADPMADSPILRSMASKETRIRFLKHLLRQPRFTTGSTLPSVTYLLSSRPAADFAAMLREDRLPSVPRREVKLIHDKPREIHFLPLEEKNMLALLNYALHDCDHRFSDRLFSHRMGVSSYHALNSLRKYPDFDRLYLYKTDIHSYDPSINAEGLSAALEEFFAEEDPLLGRFLQRLVSRRQYIEEGEIRSDGAAVQTGISLCGFFENLYLRDYDFKMAERATFYARCADDILIGAPSRQELDALIAETEEVMAEKKLRLSERKTRILSPGETFEYLGWKISGSKIDIPDSTMRKLQSKIHRETQRMQASFRRAGLSDAFRMMLAIEQSQRIINYARIGSFFHVVTCSDGLKQLDHMLCDMIRKVVTGKNTAARFRVRYSDLRKWGYRSLVGQYYEWLAGSPTGSPTDSPDDFPDDFPEED